MSRKIFPAILLAAGTVMFAVPGAAAKYAASGGLGTVEPPRSGGLGGAGTGLTGDPTITWLNPGLLSQVHGTALFMGGRRGALGDMAGQMMWSSNFRPGTAAVGISYFHAGNAELGIPGGESRTVSLQRDMALSAAWGMNLYGNIGGGIALRYLRSDLLEEATATAVAVDAGLAVPFNEMLSGGVAVQNLGTGYKYGADSLAPPTVIRLGGAMTLETREDMMGNPADHLIILQDVSFSAVDGVVVSSTGAEYVWNDVAGFRAGARLASRNELSAITAGFGLRTKGYRLDYAVSVGGPLDPPQTLSLTFVLP